jgi:hypothetical protein
VFGLSVALAAAGVAEGAELRGRLVNGSTPGGVVPSFDVRLTGRLGTGERVDRRTVSGPDGAFRFEEVEGDTADVYVLSTNYQGVDYLSPFIKYSLQETDRESDLIVYEVSDDRNALAVQGHHYIIECPPEATQVMVTEVLALSNATLKTFRSHTPLSFPVPQGATEVTPLDGFESGFFGEGAMQLSAIVRPGGLEGAFRYFVPARYPLTLPLVVAMPTEEMTVLVSPPGTKVSGRGAELTSMGPVDLGEVVCDRYGVVATGGTATIVVEPKRPRAVASVLIVAGLLLVFGAAIFARERVASPRARRRPEDPRLVAERDRHLRELVALEQQAATRGLDGDDLRTQRERLLAKAGAVQELIDAEVGRSQ